MWKGSSAALAYAAAVEAPRDVALRYRFAPTDARMLRMRLTRERPDVLLVDRRVARAGSLTDMKRLLLPVRRVFARAGNHEAPSFYGSIAEVKVLEP